MAEAWSENESVLFSLKQLQALERERLEEEAELVRQKLEAERLQREAEERAWEAARRAEEERPAELERQRVEAERERERAARAEERRWEIEAEARREQARIEAEARAVAELRRTPLAPMLAGAAVLLLVVVGAVAFLLRQSDEDFARERAATAAREDATQAKLLAEQLAAQHRVEQAMAELKAKLEAARAPAVVAPAPHPLARVRRPPPRKPTEADKKVPEIAPTDDPLGFLNSL